MSHGPYDSRTQAQSRYPATQLSQNQHPQYPHDGDDFPVGVYPHHQPSMGQPDPRRLGHQPGAHVLRSFPAGFPPRQDPRNHGVHYQSLPQIQFHYMEHSDQHAQRMAIMQHPADLRPPHPNYGTPQQVDSDFRGYFESVQSANELPRGDYEPAPPQLVQPMPPAKRPGDGHQSPFPKRQHQQPADMPQNFGDGRSSSQAPPPQRPAIDQRSDTKMVPSSISATSTNAVAPAFPTIKSMPATAPEEVTIIHFLNGGQGQYILDRAKLTSSSSYMKHIFVNPKIHSKTFLWCCGEALETYAHWVNTKSLVLTSKPKIDCHIPIDPEDDTTYIRLVHLYGLGLAMQDPDFRDVVLDAIQARFAKLKKDSRARPPGKTCIQLAYHGHFPRASEACLEKNQLHLLLAEMYARESTPAQEESSMRWRPSRSG